MPCVTAPNLFAPSFSCPCSTGVCCHDPYQIIQVLTSLTKFDQVDQPIVGGAKLAFSRMNNFGLTKTPFRRPRRYEFKNRLNVKIRFTDKKLWSW